MEEGEILAWCKHEGEQVHKGEALLEVMTDKSAMVVEATEDGILRAVLAGPGETVPIKQPIAIFGTASEPIEDLLSELSAAKAAASAHAQIGAVATIERPSASLPRNPAAFPRPSASIPISEPTEHPAGSRSSLPARAKEPRIFVSPRARRIAQEEGVAITELVGRGSGPAGRIVARDVFAYMEERTAVKQAPQAASLDGWREMLQALGHLAGPAQIVAYAADRTIPGPSGPIPIRIYRPSAAPCLPCLVYFHGGGWIAGDLEMVDAPMRLLANESGWMVMTVDYRLAPENPFPAGLEDAMAAVKWVAAHGLEIGADPSRIAVGGGSAGGNLTAVVCRLARDAGEPKIAFQVLLYPMTDMAANSDSWKVFGAKNYFLTRAHVQLFTEQYVPRGTDPLDPRISPLRAKDLRGLPPTLIITAEMDPLRDEGEAYAARLRDAGVPVRLTRYDKSIHGFAGQGGLPGAGNDALREIAAELRDDRDRRRCTEWRTERRTWCTWS
jgi:acetyl esterase